MKYAITERTTNEFYPDPLYETEEKALIKIAYLHHYEAEHNMKIKDLYPEALTPEREAQHEIEWKRYISMID